MAFGRVGSRGFLSVFGPLFGWAVLSASCGGKIDPVATADAATDTPGSTDTGALDAKPPPVIDKVDVLFVIDNSLAMGDKQAVLASSLGSFFAALTGGGPGKAPVSVHAAVVTSSLGSHGSSACAVALTNPSNDDHGHPLPRPGDACAGPVVTWEGGSIDGAAANVACLVASAKQDGCGYEETLEASYHFLADPAPYVKADVKCSFGVSGDACGYNEIVVEGVDEELLKQRAAFLRPDSVLAVVYLSDENDASLRPAGKNWWPWSQGSAAMMRGWKTCAALPDDFEPDDETELTKRDCHSCLFDPRDADCKLPWAKDRLNSDPDSRNLRAFHQVQRFGFNYLWSRDRYVKMFTQATVARSDRAPGPNGIFVGGARTSDMVFVLPIVGASPQHVVDPTNPNWSALAGPIATRDPHMIESIVPRDALKRFAGDRTVDPTHGGDRDVPNGDSLQYACIAPRPAGSSGALDCESLGIDAASKDPLCESSSKQPYMGAFPGLRFLRVASALGPQALAGSICATTYAPPLTALANKIRLRLK